MQPELEARKRIDALLEKPGWIVQDRPSADPKAGAGVPVREFLFESVTPRVINPTLPTACAWVARGCGALDLTFSAGGINSHNWLVP